MKMRLLSGIALLCGLALCGNDVHAEELKQANLAGSWSGNITVFGTPRPASFNVDVLGKITGGTIDYGGGSSTIGGELTIGAGGKVTGTLDYPTVGFTLIVDLKITADGAPNKLTGTGMYTTGAGPETISMQGGTGSGGGGGGDPPGPPLPIIKPDLVVSELTLSENPPTAGNALTVSASITNTGNLDSEGCLVAVFLNQSVRTSGVGGAAGTASLPPLKPGASAGVTFSITYPEPGPVTLAVLADAANTVIESSDINNMLFMPLNVYARGVDLAVKSITRSEPRQGFDAVFDLVVENRGRQESDAFRVAFHSNRMIRPRTSDAATAVRDVPSLAANGRVTLTFSIPTQETARGGRAWFVVDSSEAIAEAIESNNFASATWGVANDAFTIVSHVIGTPGVVGQNETVTFNVAASDPNNDPISYAWDFGDGVGEAGGAQARHAYTAAGEYRVKVIVADGPFHDAISETTVSVESAAIDLGAVSRGQTRGKLNLAIPLPDGLTKKDRAKAVIVSGTPGNKAKLRAQRLRALLGDLGTFKFTVEYSTKSGKSARVNYKYTVIE